MLRPGLFTKYVAFIAGLVTVAVLASSAIAAWFFGEEYRAQLAALQREKAVAASSRIELFIRDIEHQIGWTELAYSDVEQRRQDYHTLLRQVPAITEVAWLDPSGKERLRVSRLAMDVVGAGTDHSGEPMLESVGPGRTHFGAVYFRQGTEPYMAIARMAGDSGGVTVAEINLKFVWDVVSRIKVGKEGLAFIVDSNGALVAHPDMSLVLQKKRGLTDLAGRDVLSATAPIPALGWNVFVELPTREALQPLREAFYRTGLLLVAGLALSVLASMVLARRMVRPIRALQAGADEVGAGRMDHQIEVRTGDELESVAQRFNSMTRQLRESYEHLENKVAERTEALSRTNADLTRALAALEQARRAKTRFLAAASHDLRQPITTIGLLADLLGERTRGDSRLAPLVDQLREAARATESLLVGLMDVSRLDAGVERPALQPVRLRDLFDPLRSHAQAAAEPKGLRVRFRAGHWTVMSDPVLLGRELRNLVDNAIRYTSSGGVLVAARPDGASSVRVEVWDTGIGIDSLHQERVFEEFYQVGNAARDRRLGTGLGLAIVKRTAELLGHSVRLTSVPGKGSCFSIVLPVTADPIPAPVWQAPMQEPLLGWSTWLVEDDAALHQALTARLRAWGAEVRGWPDAEALLAALHGLEPPDLLLTDLRLPGMDGLQLARDVARALELADSRRLRTVLISGDTESAQLTRIAASGMRVLAKPFTMEELLEAILRRTTTTSVRA